MSDKGAITGVNNSFKRVLEKFKSHLEVPSDIFSRSAISLWLNPSITNKLNTFWLIGGSCVINACICSTFILEMAAFWSAWFPVSCYSSIYCIVSWCFLFLRNSSIKILIITRLIHNIKGISGLYLSRFFKIFKNPRLSICSASSLELVYLKQILIR